MEALAYKETVVRKPVQQMSEARYISRAIRRKRIMIQVLLITAISIFSTLYLVECVKGLNYQQKTINYTLQLNQLDKQCEEVDARLAELRNLGRLEAEAKKLGMVYPKRHKFLDFSNNRLSLYTE
ncbi:MAG: hypothetical protein M1269_11125 [Chloroflexi bacterium]|nr:hypothetical protein [Chloroflexota bacterium]